MALKLPRFLRDLAIVSPDTGTPTIAFHQWWEAVLKQIELSINAITDALEAANIAIAAAATAQTAANAAQTSANTATSTAKLTTSGITGLTFTATDAGSSATITISSHTRVYGDGTSVSVSGGSLTGLSYDTQYYVYYDNPGFTGGAVTYQSTTSMATAAQTGVRHLIGAIKTPLAGGAAADGGSPRPPGFDFEIP